MENSGGAGFSEVLTSKGVSDLCPEIGVGYPMRVGVLPPVQTWEVPSVPGVAE
jgi:hypothetical protein